MDQGSDDIRQGIEDTRAALTDKLSLLEDKANEVSNNVKQAFDVKAQVSERPWAALGVALAAGYVLGNLGESSTTSATASYNRPASVQPTSSAPSTMDAVKSGASDFLSQFDDEIDLLKGAAFATITDLLRQTVRDVSPMVGDHLDGLIRNHGGNLGLGSVAASIASNVGSKGSQASTGANTSKVPSTAPGQSFSETNTDSADYDEIGGAQNRYGAPPNVSTTGTDYYDTYSPSPDQEDKGSRATVKTYNQ